MEELNPNFFYAATLALGAAQLLLVYDLTAATMQVASRTEGREVVEQAEERRDETDHRTGHRADMGIELTHDGIELAGEPGVTGAVRVPAEEKDKKGK